MGCIAVAKQSISLGLSVVLVFTLGPGVGTGMAYQTTEPAPAAGTTAASYPGQGAPQTADELQALVAPIALYPDALVAQILSAATFPDQVAIANYWVQQNKTLTGSALTTAVDKQTWDPSVKALTEFPSVLNNMAQNLSWTSQLGEAYHTQQADTDVASEGEGCGQSEVGLADHGCAAVAADHRHSADEPADCVCAAVQSDGYLWDALRGSELHHRRCRGRWGYDLRAWIGSGSDDEQRVGVQQLELQLVRWCGLLSRWGVLREHRLAWGLLRDQRRGVWSVWQRAL